MAEIVIYSRTLSTSFNLTCPSCGKKVEALAEVQCVGRERNELGKMEREVAETEVCDDCLRHVVFARESRWFHDLRAIQRKAEATKS